jgi:DNA-damage-inducible protein J
MKASQSTIQIRVDTKTKEAARKTLDELGLDMSSAVKLFLHNVVITQSLPLNLRTANGFTVAQEREMMADLEDVKKNGKRFSSVAALMKDLNS